MKNKIINTVAAPAAIGTYSQAVIANDLLFVSGQLPLKVDEMDVISQTFSEQAHQVFKNLEAIVKASRNKLANAVKLTVYLTDLNDFQELNSVMESYFSSPYPARAAVQVAALPKGAMIEIDAILTMD